MNKTSLWKHTAIIRNLDKLLLEQQKILQDLGRPYQKKYAQAIISEKIKRGIVYNDEIPLILKKYFPDEFK